MHHVLSTCSKHCRLSINQGSHELKALLLPRQLLLLRLGTTSRCIWAAILGTIILCPELFFITKLPTACYCIVQSLVASTNAHRTAPAR